MPKIPKYTVEHLDKALEEIRGGVTMRAAAKKYGIPRASLQFKLKNPITKSNFGPTPILSKSEERDLADWICDLSRKGFPRKKDDILNSVQCFLKENPRPNPFINDRPGKGWMKAFLKRHPNIVERTSEAVSGASSCVSEKDIRKWFSQIDEYITEKGLNIVLKDSSRIFNADESGFQTCPSSGRVFAHKGDKNIYAIDKRNAKESITVLFTFSADGKTKLPLIIYPYKRIPERISISVPREWGIGRSDSGWMTTEVFYEFIKSVFHPYLVLNKIKLPVILFVDGHKSHLSYELSLLCNQLQIEIIALYPNATRILQPADVSVFGPVKQMWRKAVREWNLENPDEIVAKTNFATILKTVVGNIKPEYLINGFRTCGLHPFDADAVDYTKCLSKGAPQITIHGNDESTQLNTMEYDTFCKIVGEENVQKFRTIEEVIGLEKNTDEFYMLFQMWTFFNRKNIDEIGTEHEKNIMDSSTLRAQEHGLNPSSASIQEDGEDQRDGDQTIISSVPGDLKELKEYLFRPKEPARRGKRDIAKSPYAVSSREFQECMENKARQKKVKDDEKNSKRVKRLEVQESRKRKIQEKKRKKNNKKNKNNPVTISKTIDNDQHDPALAQTSSNLIEESHHTDDGDDEIIVKECRMCKRRIKTDSYLKCEDCKEHFHDTCVPKKHIHHVPHKEDGDTFLCHMCYMVADEQFDTMSEGNGSDMMGTEDILELLK